MHAYLMYGFPTQTVQETVDSLVERFHRQFRAAFVEVLQRNLRHLVRAQAGVRVGLPVRA